MRKVISIFLSTLISMVVSTSYYMLITKISSTIANDYKNVNIFFQDVNPRDVIYMINPLVVAISLFLLWLFSNDAISKKFNNKLLTICIFSIVYALIIVPILLFNYASLKISFAVVFGWFCQFYIQAFLSGLVFSKLKITL